jgi:hypothetical protein
MKTKPPEQRLLDEPEYKRVLAEYGLPQDLLPFAAKMICASRVFPPAMDIKEAFRLSREWLAVLERLEALGCIRRDTLRRGKVRRREVPRNVLLLRCPWPDEHRGSAIDHKVAYAPSFMNGFKGEYDCPRCGTRRGYLDLVGLLKHEARQ